MSPAADEWIDEDRRDAIRRLGFREIPEIVAELGSVVARGNSVAALAGPGSGKEVLYALAAAECCSPEAPSVQALVLTPTRETALAAAEALHQLGAPAGLDALAWLPWDRTERGDGDRPFAELLAGRPGELLAEVRGGRLQVGDLRLLVVDGVTALEATHQWDGVAALLDTLDPETQKIVVDHRRGDRFQQVITHQLGRARKWPRELFAGEGEGGREGLPPLVCGAAPDAAGRIDLLALGIRRGAQEADTDRAFVLCRDEAGAHRVAAGLAARGFELSSEPAEPGVVVAWGDEEEPPTGVGALYGLPSGLPELRRWLEPAAGRVAVVRPEEIAQLTLLGRRAEWRLDPLAEPVPDRARDVVGRFRDRLRRRLEAFDDAADLLVLEPLLEEYGASRVAAALSALFRERGARVEEEEEERAGEPTGKPRAGGARERPRQREPAAGRGERKARASGGWKRLYISAGDRDDVGPSDLVGAITGETSAVGSQVGQIQVRDTYSLVDVDAEIADEVMEKLTGVQIKGREVLARPDRYS